MADQRIQYTEEMVGAGHSTKADTLNRLARAFALENDGTFQDHYIRIIDEKAATVTSGTFTSGAWRTRDLNTIDSDVGGHASLSSNQITLAAGAYEFSASCPAWKVAGHKARLYNITDATVIKVGTSEWNSAVDEDSSHSHISGKFTIAAPKVIELQHYCTTTAGSGFGIPSDFSAVEVYTVIEFRKVG